MQTTAAITFKEDSKVLGLVASGHFLSHFYMLLLPPLFVILKIEYGVSYAALGLLFTVYNGISGVVQIPVGFMVDRLGARAILIGGLIILAIGIGLVGLSHSYWTTLLLIVVAGTGHSVFHPANYSILSAGISPKFVGRAFSIHTFAGHLGGAVAPATIGVLMALWGWRTGLLALGAVGVLIALLMILNRNSLYDTARSGQKDSRAEGESQPGQPVKSDWTLLFSRPMVLFFLFFAACSMTSGGIHAFSIAALVDLHDIPLAMAGSALSFYLFASTGGILAGGFLADYTRRHDLVAGGAFLISAALFMLIGLLWMPIPVLYLVMAATGLCQGLVRPARDMMVRAASPQGASGKVFGFVSTGIALGGAISPVIFGWVVDQGASQWVFYLAALIMLLALSTLVAQKQPAT